MQHFSIDCSSSASYASGCIHKKVLLQPAVNRMQHFSIDRFFQRVVRIWMHIQWKVLLRQKALQPAELPPALTTACNISLLTVSSSASYASGCIHKKVLLQPAVNRMQHFSIDRFFQRVVRIWMHIQWKVLLQVYNHHFISTQCHLCLVDLYQCAGRDWAEFTAIH